jgi:hypothetical protein
MVFRVIVALLRTSGSPMTEAVSAMIGYFFRISSDESSSDSRVIAPIVRCPSDSRM